MSAACFVKTCFARAYFARDSVFGMQGWYARVVCKGRYMRVVCKNSMEV